MSKLVENVTTFLVCVILSLVFHVTVLFGLSGYTGFSFFEPGEDEIISVDLGSEEAPKALPLAARHLVKGSSHQGEQETKRQELSQDKLTAFETAGYSEDAPGAEETPSVSDPSATLAEKVRFAGYSREVLSYDIYWMGIYAGSAILESEDKNGIFKITSRVKSAPVVSAFYRVEDHAESIITNGLPFKLRLRLREGAHSTDKETVFDNSNRKITFINYLKGNKKEHVIPEGTFWDVLSGFYHLRTQRLLPGTTAYVNIFDSNKFFRAEVSVLKKEIVNVSGLGEMPVLLIKPELKSEGLFKKTGDIFIWLTDDDRKIPVRVETRIPVGKVVAELRGVETTE